MTDAYAVGRWSLGGLDLGLVQDERPTDDANLMLMPIPMQPADRLFAFDFSGSQEQWQVNGCKMFNTGSSADDLTAAKAFAGTGVSSGLSGSSLRGIISGNQQTTIDYVSEFYGTIKVKVMTIEVYFDQSAPYPRVLYNITLVSSK